MLHISYSAQTSSQLAIIAFLLLLQPPYPPLFSFGADIIQPFSTELTLQIEEEEKGESERREREQARFGRSAAVCWSAARNVFLKANLRHRCAFMATSNHAAGDMAATYL